jgi:hypothetical protein
MPTPGEHKTVQAQIIAYAEAIGWTIVSRKEAERRRGLNRRERRERREHKEGFAGAIWPQTAAKFPGWEFWHRLCQNRLLASEHFCHSLLQNSYIV